MKFKIFILACLSSLSLIAYAQVPYVLAPPAPGFVAPGGYATCSDYMGAVSFTSAYRFRTNTANATANQNRLYGFSIPLVGDLNGDGYPEIIGILSDAVSSIEGKYLGIQIFNGQTGALISSINFPWLTAPYYYHNGYHGSPSIMALVDSDRDGTIEVIFTIPDMGGSPTTYWNDVVSCNIVYNTTTKTYSLTQKWRAQDYNNPASASAYNKPIPQVVDLDGDEKAEVIVYNKVYNAIDGTLLLTLETLGTNAFVGSDQGATAGIADQNIGFSYVYDMDLDGIYDIVAGGKIYKITKPGTTFAYTTITMTGIPDGRTGVADINGDGIPDVVTLTRSNASTASGVVNITVWDPGFLFINSSGDIEKNATPTPTILAKMALPLGTNDTAQGNNSYVYIGDIDGREQVVDGKKYRLPEIAVIGGLFRYGNFVHPNVSGLNQIPTSGVSGSGVAVSATDAGQWGVLAAVTWDARAGLATTARLKLSFLLGHEDRSINTGFTMFDFDNDGMQEICYRDEQTLRIIKASKPYVKQTETSSAVILFSQTVRSFTGFEYPVIADIDNDASAEMIVMGHDGGNDLAYGNIYAVGNGSGDKFAPALPVWNQFMYDPFKINPNLTTPIGLAPNRLSADYSYTRLVKNASGTVTSMVENYLPYNGTLAQSAKFKLDTETYAGTTYNDVYEPVVFLTEAYINSTNKAPSVDVANKQIVITIGNKASAKTDISLNTPIVIYESSVLPIDILENGVYRKRTTIVKTLGTLFTNIGQTTRILSAIKAGEEVEVRIPIAKEYGFYIVRLGDASTTLGTTPTWSFGLNKLTDTPIAGMELTSGLAQRAYRDCDWVDQVAKVAAHSAHDDASTVMDMHSIEIDVLANDHFPSTYTAGIKAVNITTQPTDGRLTFANNKITYESRGLTTLADGIDKFTYTITYTDPVAGAKTSTATVYVFVLKSAASNFVACSGSAYDLTLRTLPTGVTYDWYADDATTSTKISPAPSSVANVTADLRYFVEPRTAGSGSPYNSIVFPRGELVVKVVPTNALLRWTGTVSSNWNNAANWEVVDRSTQIGTPSTYGPSTCTEVIVPTVISPKFYPALLDKNVHQAGLVRIVGRGMLQNSFRLTYASAAFDMTFNHPSETNRWLLYSAPLTGLFSGDFTTKDASLNQNPRATYISLYEGTNPDNKITAAAHTFTQPFGKVDKALTLGGAYMLYMDTQYDATPKLQIGANYSFLNLSHSALGAPARQRGAAVSGSRTPRFIYESGTAYTTTGATPGSFTVGYSAGSSYVLVTNPFPAYLNLQAFLKANNTILDTTGYKIWGGASSDTFITRAASTPGANTTWSIKMPVTDWTTVGVPIVYIAPFQSFFVKKIGASTTAISIKYDPLLMTTTFAEAGGYILK